MTTWTAGRGQTSRLLLKQEDLGSDNHGRSVGVCLLLDISRPVAVKEKYWVVTTRDQIVIACLGPSDFFWASELYEAYCLGLHPRGDTGLRAVLDRCMGVQPSNPGEGWEGSAAQFASKHYKVGSYPWVLLLVNYRGLMTESAQAHARK